MKAICLRVRSSRVRQDPRIIHPTDKVFDADGKTSRYDRRSKKAFSYLKVTPGRLDYRHVANLLRVMCGQRPVPTLRKAYFTGNPWFEQVAKNARIKIETPIIRNWYPIETGTIRKAIRDPWQTATIDYILDGIKVSVKGGLMYWDRLKRFLGEDLYRGFINTLMLVSGLVEPEKRTTAHKAIELLNANKSRKEVKKFCSLCKKKGRTSLANVILNNNPDSITFHTGVGSKLNMLMVCTGVENIGMFDAYIFIPLDEKDIGQFSNGTGVATFLEGGVVSLESIEDWSELINAQTLPVEQGELICT